MVLCQKQLGHHCILLIGGHGSTSIKQLPQAQYQQFASGVVSANEQNIHDLTTGNNINISCYTMRYHLLQSVSLHVISI